ncbi:MAG TPA: hypothetical protein VF181_05770 [Balneolaceae bacterium]
MLKNLLVLVLLSSGVYYYWITRPVTHGPGIVAPEAPVQKAIGNEDPFHYKGFKLTPKAKIEFEARVLSIENYYFDSFTELTNTDIVFGWGEMSDERNLESLLVRQSDRSFYWEMTTPPIEQHQMWQQTANMHLIGPTKEIRQKIKMLRKGHIVKVEGTLVNASSESWTFKTSLSREDIGNGSGELIWINSISIL